MYIDEQSQSSRITSRDRIASSLVYMLVILISAMHALLGLLLSCVVYCIAL